VTAVDSCSTVIEQPVALEDCASLELVDTVNIAFGLS
jgi:hypothetical protein